MNTPKHTPGALALRVASDALSHDAALKPKWKVPDGLRKDMERAADDLRELINERDRLAKACAGLNPEAIPALVEAVDATVRGEDLNSYRSALLEVLAAVRGSK